MRSSCKITFMLPLISIEEWALIVEIAVLVVVVLEGLPFLIGYLNRPKIDVKVILNPIYENNQLIMKELYLQVSNVGKSTARRCHVVMSLPELPFKPHLELPSPIKLSLDKLRNIELDWFEPSIAGYGVSSTGMPKLGKEIDLFPDPNRLFLIGTIQMSRDHQTGKGIAPSIVTTGVVRGVPTTSGYGVSENVYGQVIDVEVKFIWERQHRESYSEKYRLDSRSFETFGMMKLN